LASIHSTISYSQYLENFSICIDRVDSRYDEAGGGSIAEVSGGKCFMYWSIFAQSCINPDSL